MNKTTILLIGLLFYVFLNNTFCQEIEEIGEVIPIYKKVNQLTVQKSYQISLRPSYFSPLAGTKSYIKNTEFEPFGLSFDIVQPQKYSIGFELSHQYFQEYKPRAVYDYDGTLISTAQMRTITNMPIFINYSKYFTKADATIRPYAQIGGGVVRIHYNTFWGYIEDEKIRWAPSLSPAIGFKINLDKSNNWLIDSKLKYIIAPFKYDFINKLNYLSFDVSIGFRWWK